MFSLVFTARIYLLLSFFWLSLLEDEQDLSVGVFDMLIFSDIFHTLFLVSYMCFMSIYGLFIMFYHY